MYYLTFVYGLQVSQAWRATGRIQSEGKCELDHQGYFSSVKYKLGIVR
jgi:hypothetical protein